MECPKKIDVKGSIISNVSIQWLERIYNEAIEDSEMWIIKTIPSKYGRRIVVMPRVASWIKPSISFLENVVHYKEDYVRMESRFILLRGARGWGLVVVLTPIDNCNRKPAAVLENFEFKSTDQNSSSATIIAPFKINPTKNIKMRIPIENAIYIWSAINECKGGRGFRRITGSLPGVKWSLIGPKAIEEVTGCSIVKLSAAEDHPLPLVVADDGESKCIVGIPGLWPSRWRWWLYKVRSDSIIPTPVGEPKYIVSLARGRCSGTVVGGACGYKVCIEEFK